MIAFESSLFRAVLVGLLLGSLGLASCDFTAAGSTAILNAESTIPPVVEYTFEYTPSDTTGTGQVEVASEALDDLGGVLSENGFSRDDVVSARVDSVSIERLSAPTFGYVTGADVHLGTSTEDPRIATGAFDPSQEAASLDVVTETVTKIVTRGSTRAFARLDVDDPNDLPGVDRVQVIVYFRLEVEGV